MLYFIVIAQAAFCFWLLFMDGAEQIEGSWFTQLVFRPGMEAREIRVGAFLSLLWIPIWLLL